MSASGRVVLAVTGLKREAELLAADGVRTVVGGGDNGLLLDRLHGALNDQIVGVLSVGLGGALSPLLALGDWVVATAIVTDDAAIKTDQAWTTRLDHSLRYGQSPLADAQANPFPLPPRRRGSSLSPVTEERPDPRPREESGVHAVHLGPLAGVDGMVVDAVAKAALHARTGALAVDMESHVTARFAAERGLPFAALRVVSDAADRALPPAAQAGMKKDGGMDILAVLKALAVDPRQLPALIRTGREAQVAFGRLRLLGGDHLLCGPGIGCPYLG